MKYSDKCVIIGILGGLILAASGLIAFGAAMCAVTPGIVGDTDADSVYIIFAVNDSLGNAASCDSAWVVRFYNSRAFDSTKLTSEYGARSGLYALPCRASAGNDSVGAYWVEVRAYGVGGRNPHATYSYTVVNGGPVGEDALRKLVSDSNLARYATRLDYRLPAGDPWDVTVAMHASPITTGGFLYQMRQIIDTTGDTSRMRRLLTEQINVAREETKTDYQSTTGPGPTPVRLLVADAADTSSVAGVHLTVKLAADQTKKHEAITGADGWSSMTLNQVVYDIFATANNYTFSTPALALAVAGDSVRDTIWAAAFDPGIPDDPQLCRVYGWVSDLSGEPIENITVSARAAGSPVRYQNLVLSPYEQTTASDSSGYWFLDLIPSADLQSSSTQYHFTIHHQNGAILRKKVEVPDTSSWQLVW